MAVLWLYIIRFLLIWHETCCLFPVRFILHVVLLFLKAQLFLECEMISCYTTHRVRHWCTSWENHPSELSIYNWTGTRVQKVKARWRETEEWLDAVIGRQFQSLSTIFVCAVNTKLTRSVQKCFAPDIILWLKRNKREI